MLITCWFISKPIEVPFLLVICSAFLRTVLIFLKTMLELAWCESIWEGFSFSNIFPGSISRNHCVCESNNQVLSSAYVVIIAIIAFCGWMIQLISVKGGLLQFILHLFLALSRFSVSFNPPRVTHLYKKIRDLIESNTKQKFRRSKWKIVTLSHNLRKAYCLSFGGVL